MEGVILAVVVVYGALWAAVGVWASRQNAVRAWVAFLLAWTVGTGIIGVPGFAVGFLGSRQRARQASATQAGGQPPPRTQVALPAPGPNPETKVCPDCAEEVKWAARICRFCRYEFAPPDAPLPSTPQEPVVAGAPEALHQSDASTLIEDSRRLPGGRPPPAMPQYSGDWRVLATEFDGLAAGDDVTLVVDDWTLRILGRVPRLV